ncbi:MAG TPA: TIGR02530 family flagellar biosynthesis protein [Candidatus Kapabacteria bacterium]|nr:TIGR02530 family flagellar biosynthesis protein [Candidatus Kapabacteria bacterium]
MLEINGVSVPFMPVTGVDKSPKHSTIQSNPKVTAPFSEIFKEELGKVKFSGHALDRMNSREINLNEHDLQRLENAVNKAEEKNARDSLVMMDNKAFIVNIPNRTVVTMLTNDKMNEHIITQIDSAVFA